MMLLRVIAKNQNEKLVNSYIEKEGKDLSAVSLIVLKKKKKRKNLLNFDDRHCHYSTPL